MTGLLKTLEAIADAVKKAIDLIPSLEERGQDIAMGADGTPTSEVDKVAENTVLDYILRNEVELNVLSEEIGFVDNGYEETLVLDPIDGTSNAIAGVPMYTISMAVGTSDLKGLHTAYLRNLATGESMWAEKGKGAFKDGKPIKVRPLDFNQISMNVYLGNGADPKAFKLVKRIKSSRSYGCASLEMELVAEGQADGFYMNSERYSRGIRVVDIAASYLILMEAGGCVMDLKGQPFNMPFDLASRSNFLACNDRRLFDFVVNGDLGIEGRMVYGLAVNPNLPDIRDHAERVLKALEGEEVVLDSAAGTVLGTKGTPLDEMKADVMITIGGDGTILRTAMNTKIPILGINGGGVGFLADVEINDIENGIERLRNGDYVIEERFKIDSYIDGKSVEPAVNEAVIHTDSIAKIRQFKIFVDGKLSTEVRADGVIISTPTGSTCYAMSLGAPIVDPGVDAFIIVPIAAYKFTSRPFVVPADAKITVECVLDKGCMLVLDGQTEHHLDGGSRIDITRSSEKIRFIRFNTDFYSRVRTKLVNAI
ncbi:MAG: NAD(+)/NADH kinase [archaeon]|nr:NAD(+)/NADH kinase [archaeon]